MSATAEPFLGPLSGWRLFSLGQDGVLRPPFAGQYWPNHLRPADTWQPGLNIARCLFEPEPVKWVPGLGQHRAPVVDCTCGIRATRDLSELLRACSAVLVECGVFARVKVQGLLLPESDMPTEDSRTTVRAAAATLLEVHLPYRLSEQADLLGARYPEATVTVSPHWPRHVDPEAEFLRDVRARGFGKLQLDSERQSAILLNLARELPAVLRAGATRTDAAVTLFDSGMYPTWQQARNFVAAAVRHLAPELADDPDGRVHARNLTVFDLARDLNLSVFDVFARRSPTGDGK